MTTTPRDSQRAHDIQGVEPARDPSRFLLEGTPPLRPVWEVILELGAQISDGEWAKVPQDASINYRHYLRGAPKKSA
jgi:hypothetical protein